MHSSHNLWASVGLEAMTLVRRIQYAVHSNAKRVCVARPPFLKITFAMNNKWINSQDV